MSHEINPVSSSERYIILDILRGIALLGICLANYPEFSLYTFQKPEVTAAMPTAHIDHIVKFFQYLFIDGKFYTLFALLFGIGFTIILSNAGRKGTNGRAIFYRRMITLLLIGFLHMILLWAGDILVLYAAVGLLLPWFWKTSGKRLLILSAICLFIPVLLDAAKVLSDYRFDLAVPVIKATQYFHGQFGIDDDNFGVWLVQAQTYADVLKFNWAGFFIRCQEFIDGHRAFKVLALFLLGLYIGRNRLYAKMDDNKCILRKIRNYGFLIGLPTSLLYAWESVNGHTWGLVAHSFLYSISVVPMSFAYTAVVCLWYMKQKEAPLFRLLAAPGRTALSNYIGQSAIGMLIFYGIGFALGASMGLIYVEIISLCVYVFMCLVSYGWMYYFRFGPLEWVWRMMIYGKRLKLIR